MWRLVVGCYPSIESAHFDRISTSSVACYVALWYATDLDVAERRARESLAKHGWVTYEVLERELVDVALVEDAREFYERAEINGLTFNVYQVPRQFLPGHPRPGELDLRFVEAVAALGAGGFTYVGSRGEQAIGDLEEEPFFPLWLTDQAAASCEDEWKRCSIAAIGPDQLPAYLEEQNDAERMLALCLTDSSMVMFHPLALRDALRPDVIARYAKRATGEKYLIDPSK